MAVNHSFIFSCTDNGGKRQSFTVKAPDKQTAIKKGFERAKKHAKGDIGSAWYCRFVQ